MPYNFTWGSVNSSNLKKNKIKLPVPYLAQAYFLDSEANLHFYGGAPSQDFFVSKNETLIKKHLFSRYHPFSFFNCKQGAAVTVNHSKYFSNFISNNYSDPRFDLSLISRIALGHNSLAYLELKMCYLLTRGLFYMPQGGYFTFRVESVSPLTMLSFLPLNVRHVKTKDLWQTHYLKFALISRHYTNVLCENVSLYSDRHCNLFEKWLNYTLFLRECGVFRKLRVAKIFLSFLKIKRPNLYFRSNTFLSHRTAFSSFFRGYIRKNNPSFLEFTTLSGLYKFKGLVVPIRKVPNHFYHKISVFNSFLDNILGHFFKRTSIFSLRSFVRNQTMDENISQWFRVLKLFVQYSLSI